MLLLLQQLMYIIVIDMQSIAPVYSIDGNLRPPWREEERRWRFIIIKYHCEYSDRMNITPSMIHSVRQHYHHHRVAAAMMAACRIMYIIYERHVPDSRRLIRWREIIRSLYVRAIIIRGGHWPAIPAVVLLLVVVVCPPTRGRSKLDLWQMLPCSSSSSSKVAIGSMPIASIVKGRWYI